MKRVPAPAKNSRETLGVLEIGRFIAASVVVFCHLKVPIALHMAPAGPTIFGKVDFPGAGAVEFFFVLSGFVMMSAHHRDFGKPGATLKFWWRRACRVYPMYWIALIVPVYLLTAWPSATSWVQFITLQPVNVPELTVPAWSLRFEIGFYVMFGLCLLPYVGKPILAAWIAAVCYGWATPAFLKLLHVPIPFWLLNFYVHHDHGFFRSENYLSPSCFYFFAGLSGGWMFTRWRLNALAGAALMIAGLAGVVATLHLTGNGHSYGSPAAFIYVGYAFAALITGAALLERATGWPRDKIWARRLGAVSYPLYIMHQSLLLIFRRMHFSISGVAASAAVLAALVVVIYGAAALLAFGVDQPLQNWLRHRRRSAPARAGAPGRSIAVKTL